MLAEFDNFKDKRARDRRFKTNLKNHNQTGQSIHITRESSNLLITKLQNVFKTF